jgi:uncharacterized protein (DUF2164 family)
MAIKLSPEITRQLQESIKRYFAEHLDQDIGDLKAGLVLDYCLKEIGPAVYNRAIADAQAHFQDRIADLEGVCTRTSSLTGRRPPHIRPPIRDDTAAVQHADVPSWMQRLFTVISCSTGARSWRRRSPHWADRAK